eukprot:tig00000042_g15677.t1
MRWAARQGRRHAVPEKERLRRRGTLNVSVRRGRSESVVCAGRPDKGGGTPSRRRNASGDGALVRSALATGSSGEAVPRAWYALGGPTRAAARRPGEGTPPATGHSVRRGRSESVVCAGRPDKGGGTPSRRRNASGDGALVRSALATGCRSESVVCAGRPDKGGGTPSRRRNASGDGALRPARPFRERGMRWAARQGRRHAVPEKERLRRRGTRTVPVRPPSPPGRGIARSAAERGEPGGATGTVALREIRKYQKSFDPLIAYAPFERLVRSVARPVRAGADVRVRRGAYLQVKEIAHFEKKRREEAGFDADELRWSRDAILALREATEMHLIRTFDEANLLAIHRNRITIAPKVGKRAAPAPADREA